MVKSTWKKYRWKLLGSLLLLLLGWGVWSLFSSVYLRDDFDIVDELGGNFFPSALLSVATTGAQVILPADSVYLGDPRSGVSIRIRSRGAYTRVRIELAETDFYFQSVSEFILARPYTEYTIYPDILWKYERLRDQKQPQPMNVRIRVERNDKMLGQRSRTYSVRSINECLLGYIGGDMEYHDTSVFFAAYVNEDHPMIDRLLREALDTRIVDRFQGYQSERADAVDRQVYALWYVLQKRNFRYSSVSTTSLSSNIVYSQRVRTLDDALEMSQINCVDGSVLFASLLRAISITPVLIRVPGHMFVGYYTDASHGELHFIETTMIGDVDLDEFFPDEDYDETARRKTPAQLSLFTYEKSKEYACRLYYDNKDDIHAGELNYMFLEISNEVRRDIQPLGK
ncbi:MAG: hypothetical protein LUF85_15665 [Bacteroides sp.]|nr:hypothetical protein [Bacteroides sp.]